MDTVTITVRDETPPVITRLQTSPNLLWPPNHKLVPVQAVASATDNCTEAVACEIASVTSSEPVVTSEPQDRSPDWVINDSLELELRAERSGEGPGRTYTIEVGCRDDAGNEVDGMVPVDVPHDQRKN